jgi:hypothetical protein
VFARISTRSAWMSFCKVAVSVRDVQFWIGEHDAHPREARTQENLVRGPTRTGPAISQTLFEFLRIFGSTTVHKGQAWELSGAKGPSAVSSVTRAPLSSGAGNSAAILTVADAPRALANPPAGTAKNITGLRSRPLAHGRSSQGDGSHVLRRFSSDIPIPRLDPNIEVGSKFPGDSEVHRAGMFGARTASRERH